MCSATFSTKSNVLKHIYIMACDWFRQEHLVHRKKRIVPRVFEEKSGKQSEGDDSSKKLLEKFTSGKFSSAHHGDLLTKAGNMVQWRLIPTRLG